MKTLTHPKWINFKAFERSSCVGKITQVQATKNE